MATTIPMMSKMDATEPYNVFFTNIPGVEETAKEVNSIDFGELLCPSLGQIKESLHITYMVESDWLMDQYKSKGLEKTPITLIYDRAPPDKPEDLSNDRSIELKDACLDKYDNIKHKRIISETINRKGHKGKHHARMSIFRYNDDSLRVIVMGASLWSGDWEVFQNVLWVGPKCPPIQGRSPMDGDSGTGFKETLVNFLADYSLRILNQWVDIIKDTDFTAVKVFLITTTPGLHKPQDKSCHMHQISNILSRFCHIPKASNIDPTSWELHASISGLGYFGENAGEWLNNIITLLRKTNGYSPSVSGAKLRIIYPTMKNVASGNDIGFKYEKSMHEKQTWIEEYLYQWKADQLNRSSPMASCKTYALVAPGEEKLAWFLLTSANLSKNGWGYKNRFRGGSTNQIVCRSYEAGVLFLPKLFKQEVFTVGHVKGKEEKLFPILYDLPLTPYGVDDQPFCK